MVGFKGIGEFMELKCSSQDRIDVVKLYKDRMENLKNTNESDLQKAALFVMKDTYQHEGIIKTFAEYLESRGGGIMKVKIITQITLKVV